MDPDPQHPEKLAKDPKWKETTRPGQAKDGHREFENAHTREKIRFDKGKPGKPGHEGHDHYHRENPKKTGDHDYYLDDKKNPVPRDSEASHLYRPEQVWWIN